MPLDEMAAEPAVGAHRPLEVDALPGRSDPSVVTRAVSGPMSASHAPASRAVTVRQTPSTDTLSPSCSSPASGGVEPQPVARLDADRPATRSPPLQ